MGFLKNSSVWIVGLALFSMFFGSGNLIFPLSIGQQGQDHYLWGLAGFVLTGVFLPFLGVLTIVMYSGDYTRFFGTLGKRLGFLAAFILLTVWIPLGSSPRCITLAYVNMKPYLGNMTLWLFSAFYCLLLLPISYRKSRALDILGYILTPLLLLCLLIVVIQGIRYSPSFGASTISSVSLFQQGLLEGYNTMDLIASFFFASTIIATLREQASEGHVKLALKACIVGILILGIVYVGLVAVAAANAHILVGVSKDQLLARLVVELLGPELRMIATTAVVLACVTTSIALLIVYADFLVNSVFKGRISLLNGMWITSAATFGMSIQGFHGISLVTGPLLQIFYPLLILLMLWNMALFFRKGIRVYS